MPNEPKREQNTSAGRTAIWLVHSRELQDAAFAAFWERIDAEVYAEARSAATPDEDSVVNKIVMRGLRRRCRLCGEPVVLDDPSDLESWRHADDANDRADHTAEL